MKAITHYWFDNAATVKLVAWDRQSHDRWNTKVTILFHLHKLFRVLDQTGEEEANETVTAANHYVDVNRLTDDSDAAAPAGN